MIRYLKPRRLFEVGSGHSTKIASLALARNAHESGIQSEHLCIEPFEADWLEGLPVKVLRSRVEDLPVELFGQLEFGDMLFIDSSHMIRPQGDVLYEYLEILPSLKSGVYLHIHDIFSPRDYPEDWIRRSVRMWNEQYLLEAIRSCSQRLEVVVALNYLKHSDFESLSTVCPHINQEDEPGSMYLRVS